MARTFTGSTSVYAEYVGTPPVTAYPFTMSAWLYPTVGAIQCACAISSASAATYWTIEITSGGNAYLISSVAGTTTAASGPTTTSNVWCHLCGVFASSTSRSIFLNGGNKTTDTTSSSPTGLGRVGVGIDHNSTNFYHAFNGRIAEVSIWNVALADAEVAALATGIQSRRIQPTALVGYWPLWGKSSPEPDMSGGNRVLTLTGTPAASNHAPVMPFTLSSPSNATYDEAAAAYLGRRALGKRAGSRSFEVSSC